MAPIPSTVGIQAVAEREQQKNNTYNSIQIFDDIRVQSALKNLIYTRNNVTLALEKKNEMIGIMKELSVDTKSHSTIVTIEEITNILNKISMYKDAYASLENSNHKSDFYMAYNSVYYKPNSYNTAMQGLGFLSGAFRIPERAGDYFLGKYAALTNSDEASELIQMNLTDHFFEFICFPIAEKAYEPYQVGKDGWRNAQNAGETTTVILSYANPVGSVLGPSVAAISAAGKTTENGHINREKTGKSYWEISSAAEVTGCLTGITGVVAKNAGRNFFNFTSTSQKVKCIGEMFAINYTGTAIGTGTNNLINGNPIYSINNLVTDVSTSALTTGTQLIGIKLNQQKLSQEQKTIPNSRQTNHDKIVQNRKISYEQTKSYNIDLSIVNTLVEKNGKEILKKYLPMGLNYIK